MLPTQSLEPGLRADRPSSLSPPREAATTGSGAMQGGEPPDADLRGCNTHLIAHRCRSHNCRMRSDRSAPDGFDTSDFARAFRALRTARGLSQDVFDAVSSRTYISKLERRERTPTVSKVDELASVLGVHPLTLLTLCYCETGSSTEIDRLLHQVKAELAASGLDLLP